MSCTKNKKRFLFWTFTGSHDEEVVQMGKFMVGISDDFVVRFKCKACGAERTRHFVSWSELLSLGLSNEQIEAAQKVEF